MLRHRWVMLDRWVMLAPVSHAGAGESCWYWWVMPVPVSHAGTGESCRYRWVMLTPVSHAGTGESCWHPWVMLRHRWIMPAPVSHAGTGESWWHRWIALANISLIIKRTNLSGMFNEILEFLTKLAIWKFARKRQKCKAFPLEIVPTVSLKLRRKTLYGKILRVFFTFTDGLFGVTVTLKKLKLSEIFFVFLLSFFSRESPALVLSFPERTWHLSLCGGGQVGTRILSKWLLYKKMWEMKISMSGLWSC